MTKIGCSNNGVRRVAQHGSEAAKYGHAIVDTWISPAHLGYRDTELALIKLCHAVSPPIRGREYLGMPFAEAVALAESLGITASTPAEVEAVELAGTRRAIDFVEMFKAGLQPITDAPPTVDTHKAPPSAGATDEPLAHGVDQDGTEWREATPFEIVDLVTEVACRLRVEVSNLPPEMEACMYVEDLTGVVEAVHLFDGPEFDDVISVPRWSDEGGLTHLGVPAADLVPNDAPALLARAIALRSELSRTVAAASRVIYAAERSGSQE